MHFNTLWTEEKFYVVLDFFFFFFFYIINVKTQYQAAGMLHQLQATINMIHVRLAGRACENLVNAQTNHKP